MLKRICSLKDLDFSNLMAVYEESNRFNGAEQYPGLSEAEQRLQAEQNFYAYLQQVFFTEDGAFYAVWIENAKYVCALRMEPYKDGMLLEALETMPAFRNKGYAKKLIRAVLTHLQHQQCGPVYAHVNKKNRASLAVHRSCGFQRVLEHAVYIDGSVMSNSCTLRYPFST